MNIIEEFIEIELIQGYESFSIITETLSRIGYIRDNKVLQECFILHKRERYFLVHYKELLTLDGVITEVTQRDYSLRNAVVTLLFRWGFINIIDPFQRFYFTFEDKELSIKNALDLIKVSKNSKVFLEEILGNGELREKIKPFPSIIKSAEKNNFILDSVYPIGKRNF